MKELPIIFSAPMVRALLDGRKTQTRRIIKVQPQAEATSAGVYYDSKGTRPNAWTWLSGDPKDCDTWGALENFTLPYAVGDRLWVRETSGLWMNSEGKVVLPPDEEGPAYRASMTDAEWRALRHDQCVMAGVACGASERSTGNWVVRSSIHMPRWASRITLEVTEVRVQRLQEISEEDARAEGVQKVFAEDGNEVIEWSFLQSFGALWNSLHGPGAWEANPWVAAISFKRVT